MTLFLNIKKKCLLRRVKNEDLLNVYFSEVDLSEAVERSTFVVVDTETTGLNPKRDKLVSVGALKVKNLSMDLSETFYRIVRTQVLTRKSVEVHGITEEEVKKLGRPEEEVIKEFLFYSKGSVLVGFNLRFDVEFIERVSEKYFGFPLLHYKLDVLSLWKRRGSHRMSLADLARELDIPVANLHSALEDAFITALLFLKLVHPFRDQPLSHLPLFV